MKKVIKVYQKAFNEHGDSPDSVFWPKGRQSERFHALTTEVNKLKNFSILDYGCGLAHLYDYLENNFKDFQYTGTDIVDDFLHANKKKYPQGNFIQAYELLKNSDHFDYVVASGTFSILFEDDVEKHKEIVFGILKQLFGKANKFLSVNFMTDQVDFIQKTAFHLNPLELVKFCTDHLSTRISLNQSYMPYEYTVTVWKDDSIIRPDNIYKIDE